MKIGEGKNMPFRHGKPAIPLRPTRKRTGRIRKRVPQRVLKKIKLIRFQGATVPEKLPPELLERLKRRNQRINIQKVDTGDFTFNVFKLPVQRAGQIERFAAFSNSRPVAFYDAEGNLYEVPTREPPRPKVIRHEPPQPKKFRK